MEIERNLRSSLYDKDLGGVGMGLAPRETTDSWPSLARPNACPASSVHVKDASSTGTSARGGAEIFEN